MGAPASAEATIEVKATPEAVYALVSDVPNQHRFTQECRGADWLPPATGPAPGARFRGHNQAGKARWSTTCRITAADPGRRFTYRVTGGPIKVATWSWTIEPTPDGCRVTESITDERAAFFRWFFGLVVGVKDRGAHNQRNIEKTLASLKELAESPAS
ncbi:ribosome-associated toxin RatA of RatAB toxin-antitoxin module [Crossiella equi]|uniref:Ribosome-associated toxin RatA of RatAB toxin-antitoxin module n=1 Tax=Crossiella equi TaxID=130796 RepID=A0ABS5AH66_9PSEU|nr:SRPBCC family protein [Crossiella equi]MBP2475912.1 ribosome-associated toxin RatA of RatAB toxin-antitoxin module [Crossiella equi]